MLVGVYITPFSIGYLYSTFFIFKEANKQVNCESQITAKKKFYKLKMPFKWDGNENVTNVRVYKLCLIFQDISSRLINFAWR